MGFLSYNLNFYRNELQRLESAPVTDAGLYRARQLLRMLDDLADEGYTELNELLEKEFCGASRLREYLRENHMEPFAGPERGAEAAGNDYSAEELELADAIGLAVRASAQVQAENTPFTARLRRFCRWIGYEDDTAYIFLLRDTLLPFAHYLARGRERIHPWLLSRASLASLTGQENSDDELRMSVYRALESGCTDIRSFAGIVLPEMRRTISGYPRAEKALCNMLTYISAERIIVVESGCAGTFPLLLMSLDERVDMRIYTTYPYLTGIFGERVYTTRYEENRLFETMVSQEAYFRFSGIRNGRFYVRKCTDAAVESKALAEIRAMNDEGRMEK